MTKFLGLSVLTIAAFAASALVAPGDIVTNGTFASNGADFTTYPGYAGTGNNDSSIDNFSYVGSGNFGVGTSGNPFAPDNFGVSGDPTYFAFLQQDGSLEQTITLHPNYTYKLSFVSAPRAYEGVFSGNQGQSPAADVTISNGNYLGGVAYVTAPTTTSLNADFTTTTLNFVAHGTGTTTLSLTNLSDSMVAGDQTEDFSNVVITQIGVPEPSGYILAGLGVLVLCLYSRRVLLKS